SKIAKPAGGELKHLAHGFVEGRGGVVADAQGDLGDAGVGVILEQAQCGGEAKAADEFEGSFSHVGLKEAGEMIRGGTCFTRDPRKGERLREVQADESLRAPDLGAMKLCLMGLLAPHGELL